MVFSSMPFLWLFLPIVFIVVRLLKKIRIQNYFLLFFSLVFYAWGEPKYIVVMIGSIISNWFLGLLMDRQKRLPGKRVFLIIAVILNLGVLCIFKYSNFFITTIGELFPHFTMQVRQIPLPIGISFYTFQSLSYIIDLYREKFPPQKNFVSLGLYISFFPQLIAGPIVQYKDFDAQINNRSITKEKTAVGIRRFIYGLAKKVLFANTFSVIADGIIALGINEITPIMAWCAIISYTLQIYYDFSGYSDMAIGLGKMFGFCFRENFRFPYVSRSIREFWRRWHISLGEWFREYLYIPLGGNRKGLIRTYINLLIVFFATGLWHGASWNFVLWGLYHGIFIIIERVCLGKVLNNHRLLGGIYTIIVVVFGWVLFWIEDLTMVAHFAGLLVRPWLSVASHYSLFEFVGIKELFFVILGILFSGPIQSAFSASRLASHIQQLRGSIVESFFCGSVLALSIMFLISNDYNPFIYFRF